MVDKHLLTRGERIFIKALIDGENRREFSLTSGLSISTLATMQRVIIAKMQAKSILHAIAILYKNNWL